MTEEPTRRKPARVLLHQRIADALQRDIEARFYPRGTFLPSEADLCARFEVSRGTLRRALAELASKGLIETRPGVGHQVGGSVVSGQEVESNLVAFLAPHATGAYYHSELLGGLERTLAAAGMRLVLLGTQAEEGGGVQAVTGAQVEHLLHMRPHSVVCGLPRGADASELQKLVRAGVPVVVVGDDPVGLAVDYAGTDERLGAYMISEWLADWAQEMPWCVSDATRSAGLDARLAGYSLALSSRSGDPAERPVCQLSSDCGEAMAAEVAEWAQQHGGSRRLGLFCSRPDLIAPVASGLEQAGIRVGERAAIGCVGSVWQTATPVGVPVGAAVWSAADMGVTAAHLVIMRGVKGDTRVPLRVLIAPRLVIAPEYAEPGVLGGYEREGEQRR